MFAGLFYPIIVLLLATFSYEKKPLFYEEAAGQAFGVSLGIYLLLLAAIYQTARLAKNWIRTHKSLSYGLVNSAIFLYLALFHFDFTVQFLNTFFCLFVYFTALAAYHMGSYYRNYFLSGSERETIFTYTSQQLRMWIPFVIPFLFFTLLYDFLQLLPDSPWTALILYPDSSPATLSIFFLFIAIIFFGMMLFFPYVIQKLWLCEEIEDAMIRSRLLKICQQAQFRCAGLHTWGVMNNHYTAAIIGIMPRFRYVMFTRRLLYEVTPECLEAILIHEIGHSYRKHLLILPLVFFGMFASANLFTPPLIDGISQFLGVFAIQPLSKLWNIFFPLLFLTLYIALMAVYFRLIFGFFSRLFERQADLHSYVVGTPAQHMIDALDRMATLTGHTHNTPNWHHYSIRERIDFLESAMKHPEIIDKHHRCVKRWVALYIFILTVICSLLLFSVS